MAGCSATAGGGIATDYGSRVSSKWEISFRIDNWFTSSIELFCRQEP
jgi:hypothetical protein